MQLMSFQEIAEAANGQQIPSFQGTIKKVFDQLTGPSKVRPGENWWLQNLILQDEHANEITVTWTCEDAWDSTTEGRTWLFESGRDKKDQLVGLKKEIRDKNGKHYESVKVDERAKIKPIGKCNAAPTVQAPGAAGDDLFPFDPPHRLDNGLAETRKHIMRSANLYVLCVNAVNDYVAFHLPTVAQTSEQFQAAVGTLFIEASSRRTNDGKNWWSYVDKMPETPLESELLNDSQGIPAQV